MDAEEILCVKRAICEKGRQSGYDRLCDGVIKYKPQRSPRLLEMQSSQEYDEQKKTLQKARNAVSRSGELIKKSKEIVASSQSLSAEASNLSLAKKMPLPRKIS